MPLRRLPSLRAALITSMLALPMFADGTLAAAQPVELQANSLQSAIDNFVAYLKSETNEAARTAGRIARERLHKDASAMWEDWNETAVSSWAEAGRQAHMALDWIGKWMRNQSLSDQRPEIPV